MILFSCLFFPVGFSSEKGESAGHAVIRNFEMSILNSSMLHFTPPNN